MTLSFNDVATSFNNFLSTNYLPLARELAAYSAAARRALVKAEPKRKASEAWCGENWGAAQACLRPAT